MKKRYNVLAIFIIGFILGLAVMNLAQMHTLDRLYRIQNQLNNQLLDREIKLERLNESLNKEKASIIKDLVIEVEFDGNSLVKDEIEKTIHFYMADLVGRELWSIDGEMIYKILEDRILDIEGRNIKLRVKYIILSEKISIAVKAQIMESL
ncbi:hypothetical protein [Clostridium formicaceticum]|uniref:Sporulation membrane protein YtrI C-terminal domain-containing protein n=1 Tax=Clostridium formicaceticum TaxID=1497 RepID=A0AAC9RGV5_9CLOT|nr:hypothetical protein [Clostridium formicaceticum]AOY75493.1 hypothetical protein BJL90_06030 [Clostridium formicaceticum]ARE85781.1 hypothetical protein CLFO_00970 [Clostridium formicaceticum]